MLCVLADAEAKEREIDMVMKKKVEEVEIMLRKQKIDKARLEVGWRRTPAPGSSVRQTSRPLASVGLPPSLWTGRPTSGHFDWFVCLRGPTSALWTWTCGRWRR
jgi:hypothetical protein